MQKIQDHTQHLYLEPDAARAEIFGKESRQNIAKEAEVTRLVAHFFGQFIAEYGVQVPRSVSSALGPFL